ncbi:MAG: DNA-binding response regulator [Planctomycetota bacterium]|nr:MAG: DNA-binding response regulator [Planctomycetota bacterium]
MRILIADDHGIVREGLISLVKSQVDMEVIGQAQDGNEVVRLAKELRPDIIIMDITMPGMNGIEATGVILAERPNTKIIALSMYSNKHFVAEMLKAGALGYVLKSNLFDELAKALHTVAMGRHYLSPRITDVLIEDFVGRVHRHRALSDELTDRECQIVRLLTQGLSTKQVARKLHVSPKTIDHSRRRIMDKLDFSSVAELTKYAIHEGLTTLEI